MKRKKIETPLEAFECIQEHLSELMSSEKESLMDCVGEWDEFVRGQCKGTHDAYDELHSHLRNLIKHGFDHLTVEDYSDYYDVPSQE